MNLRQPFLWPLLFVFAALSGSAASESGVAPIDWLNKWPSTDFTTHSVDYSEIDSTDIPKDGIPSISRPRFVSIKKARKWLGKNEPVMVVVVDGVARAYPLQILLYHQIINDTIKGQPLLVTFCPLCNSGIILSRKVGSKTLTFGTTGKLRNSGLIMFDRETESWWQQFTGTGIVGTYTGESLNIDLTSQIVSFSQFAERHSKGKVLSRDTGFRRKYGLNPFQGYDSIENSPLLFTDDTDPRLPAMERVLNIRIDGVLKLYPYPVVKSAKVINDSVGNTPTVIFSGSGYSSPLDQLEIANSSTIPLAIGYNRTVDDVVLSFYEQDGDIFDEQTGSKWSLFGEAISGSLEGTQLSRVDTGANFAFAALAFTPEAEIYVARDEK